MDYFEILGVKQGDTLEDIKKKAGRLFKKYHTDKNKNTKSEEKFKEVYEAYKYIRDNPSVLQVTEQEEQIDKRYIAFTVKTSIQDIYLGTEKSIVVQRNKYCAYCKGTGSSTGLSGICPTCEGKGHVSGKLLKLMGMDEKCAQCSGSGSISGHPCENCHGSKVVVEEACVSFMVGIAHYKRKALVLDGEGHQIGPNLFGSILVSLEIEPSDRIRIEEDYFCVYAKILPVQRIIGDESNIEIFGRKIPYVIEKGSSEAWVEDSVKPGLVQKVRVMYMPLQPSINDETLPLYKKILEIEKAKFNEHAIRF